MPSLGGSLCLRPALLAADLLSDLLTPTSSPGVRVSHLAGRLQRSHRALPVSERGRQRPAGGSSKFPQTDGKNEQPAAAGDVTNSTGRSTQPGGAGSESAASCSGQSGDTAGIYPPLNPFLVPPELLMRK